MIVYLDLLIIINFIFDFIILFGINILLKLRTPIIRIILASLFGEVSIFLLFIPLSTITILLCKLLISIFILLIAFKYSNINTFKKEFIYFYIISIILGGIVYLFKLNINSKNDILLSLIILLIISPYIIYKYIKENINYKNNIYLYHNVDIYINNKKYSYRGYIDTGNTIKDPYKNRSIILIDDDDINFDYDNSILVPYNTIANSGIIKCLKIDKIVIDNNIEIKDMLIGKTINNIMYSDFNCILPNTLKEILR